MGQPWTPQKRNASELTVFNGAAGWATSVEKARVLFNTLNLGVKLTLEKEEKKADVIVKVSNGKYSYDAPEATVTGSFPADKLHGKTRTLVDPSVNEIMRAVIFLPGLAKATEKQRQIVIIHEFMHAAGLNGLKSDGTKDPQDDHDTEGIMTGLMKASGDGLSEYLAIQGAKPMPPIRFGPARGKLKALWP
jgi:hypothetical protein